MPLMFLNLQQLGFRRQLYFGRELWLWCHRRPEFASFVAFRSERAVVIAVEYFARDRVFMYRDFVCFFSGIVIMMSDDKEALRWQHCIQQ